MLAKLSYYWLYRENNYVLSARQFDKKVSLALEWFD